MLIEAPYKNGDTISLKTTSGEEIVARLEKEESGFYHLHKPMALVAGQQGLGLAPYMFSVSQDSTFKIKDSVIACVLKTEKELASQYMQQTTGIAI
jgi:hypothetical protein